MSVKLLDLQLQMSHMLIGKSGLVIVDTTETTSAAKNILAEFRKITDLPVKKIILTHSHRDHVSGASIFSEGEDVQVIAAVNPQMTLL